MVDDTSIQNVWEYVNKKNWISDTMTIDGGNTTIILVSKYVIQHGKYFGSIVHLGFPIPKDYPITPPYGIHVRSDHGFPGITSVNTSLVGANWQFWSRKVNSWPEGHRSFQYYLDHVNRWLELN